MALSAKAKRIGERLTQIKSRASEINAAEGARGRGSGVTAGDLAEEAAGLGLDLIELLKERK